jgi:segregation and condensation protein B
VSADERPDSLAAQAASWVPPWERQQRQPDRANQAAAADPDISDDRNNGDDPSDRVEGSVPDGISDSVGGPVPDGISDRVEGSVPDGISDSVDGPVPDDDEDRSEANLSDDDDFDESFEGANPEGYEEGVPPELAPLPGEADGAAAVDTPAELPGEGEPEPTDVGEAPEVPLPTPVEEAAGESLEQERGPSVDAPAPLGGSDAGDVFDSAADDDVSDEDGGDLPITEVVPALDSDGSAATAVGDPEFGPGEHNRPGAGPDAGTSGVGPVASAFASRQAGAAVAVAADTPSEQRAQPRSVVPPQGRGSPGGGGVVGAADARTEDDDRARTDPAPPDQAAADGGPAGSDASAAASAAGSAAPGDGDAGPGDGAAGPGDGDAGPGAGPMADSELRAALEAILLVVDEPVAEMQLAQIIEQPTERVAAMLEDISARYTAAGHGFDLRRVAGGWRLYTRPEYAPYVERFVLDGQSVRLTQASLETLAVVAYKQPVTRSRVSAIRGVNCDGVMRTLVTRGLIEECGIERETGAYLYRTTPLFLEKLGLNSVDQLPPLAPFLPDDVEEVLDASG